jgi:hypothetical protein
VEESSGHNAAPTLGKERTGEELGYRTDEGLQLVVGDLLGTDLFSNSSGVWRLKVTLPLCSWGGGALHLEVTEGQKFELRAYTLSHSTSPLFR